MNDPMMFGMDGFDLNGTRWYDPNTGDQFTVRDSYIENNDMVIETTTGRRISSDMLERYLKWDGQGEPPMPQKQQPQPVKPRVNSDLPPEVQSLLAPRDDDRAAALEGDGGAQPTNDLDEMDPEDRAMLAGLGNINDVGMVPTNPSTGVPAQALGIGRPQNINQPVESPNTLIIDRALAKAEMPDWNLTIKWPGFPTKEISMLVDVMDIPLAEIANYYITKLRADMETSIERIGGQFEEYFDRKLHPDSDTPVAKKTQSKTPKAETAEPKKRRTKKDGKEKQQ